MVKAIAFGMGDISTRACVMGLYITSEIMLSGGAFHLCQFTQSTQSPRFPRAPGGPPVGVKVL